MLVFVDLVITDKILFLLARLFTSLVSWLSAYDESPYIIKKPHKEQITPIKSVFIMMNLNHKCSCVPTRCCGVVVDLFWAKPIPIHSGPQVSWQKSKHHIKNL